MVSSLLFRYRVSNCRIIATATIPIITQPNTAIEYQIDLIRSLNCLILLSIYVSCCEVIPLSRTSLISIPLTNSSRESS